MKKRSHGGFTLVDVLVAVAMFLVIVLPFLTMYLVTSKLNQDASYIKKATDVLKLAGEDIRTWNSDILEVLSDRVDGGKLREWKYQKDWEITHNVGDDGHKELRKDKTSLYNIFRNALDGMENWKDEELSINGTEWQKGMDIYFTVEKIQTKTGSGASATYDDNDIAKEEGDIDLRTGYDLSIRVEKENDVPKIKISERGRDVVIDASNNNGSGYYLNVTLENSKSKYTLRRVPNGYTPLEKYVGVNKISFGGKKWLKVFEPTPGDVALMYAPEDLFKIEQPFDVTGNEEVRFNRDRGWDNIASYLNNQFYNSLAYSTVTRNYTSRSWINKHTWQVGDIGAEESDRVAEYVGLLRYSEIDTIRDNVSEYLLSSCAGRAYTLTPSSTSGVYLVSKDQVSANSICNVYPVIYLDRDLYIKDDNTLATLYESTDACLKNGDLVDASSITCAGSTMKVLVYFANDLEESNLEGEYFEKVRLLIDVVDNRTNKTDDGLVIYTANNKRRNKYNWLEARNATRAMMESTSAKSARFKIIDTLKVNEDASTDELKWSDDTKDISIKKVYVGKEYEIRVWAEYMATDEHSNVNPDDYPDKRKLPKNKHEELVLRVTTSKDEPTFIRGDTGEEVDNILDIEEIGLVDKMRDYYRVSK